MIKISNKKMVALTCGAVIAFGGMALATHSVLTANAEEAQAEITLDAGEGAFGNVKTKSVSLEDGKLPSNLEVPTRDGWEFVGWFTQNVEENFWGDDANENPETDDYKVLKSTYNSFNNILYQGVVTPVSGLDDSKWKELTFTWICVTQGEQVQAGESANGASTLYAMYKPQTYTVYWHLNGWLNTYDSETHTAHRTMPEHNGYFVEYELDQFDSLKWDNHTFDGWYTDSACTTEYKFHEVGAYKINQEKVTEDLHLYAKWSSSITFDGEIRVSKPLDLLEPEQDKTFTVRCSYTLGSSKNKPIITEWESSEPSAVAFESSDVSSASAVFKIKDREIFKESNKHIYIYVTIDGIKYEAADITIGHTWGSAQTQDPTCTEGGKTEYKCKNCDATKTVMYEPAGHRLTYKNNPATCTEDASIEFYCMVCGLDEIEILENTKLGHSWNSNKIENCSGTTITTTCAICGLTDTTTDGSAVVHKWNSQYTIDKAATCTTEGLKTIYCKDCGTAKESAVIPATGHRYNTKTVPATCKTEGSVTKTCSVCNDTYVESIIPALGHDIVISKTEEPRGIITTEVCTRCDYKKELDVEEPKVEEPEIEEPKVEEPEIEEPKVEEPKVEEPKVEEPKVEEPKVEEPKVEEPEIEEPEVEEPEVEEPEIEEPEIEEPEVEEPEIEEPEVEEPEVEEPEVEEPEIEEPEVEEPEVKEPEVEEPEVEEPEIEEPEVEEPEIEEPEVEEPEVKAPEAKEPEAKEPEAKEPEVTQPNPEETKNGDLSIDAQNTASAAQAKIDGKENHTWLWLASALSVAALLCVSVVVFVKRRQNK